MGECARVAVSWTSAFLLPRAVTHFESLFSFNIEGQLARYDLHVSVSSSILEPWRAKCRDESTCKKFRWALNIALWSGIFWHGYPLRCHAAKSIRPKPKPKGACLPCFPLTWNASPVLGPKTGYGLGSAGGGLPSTSHHHTCNWSG